MTTRRRDPRILGDALIIGSGVAGLTAALTLLDRGLRVVLVTGAEPLDSNTAYAQGGIVSIGPEDSFARLESDISAAGEGICLPEAVRAVAREGTALVRTLLADRLEVPFARGPRGGFDYTKEGGHSTRRILHVDDATGNAIARALFAAVRKHPGLRLLPHHAAVDLIACTHHSKDPLAVYRANRCLGAYCLDETTGEVKTILAPAVILATGGAGRVYLHTTNPPRARGDGLAMAHRAGVPVVNAEYIQFHPTSLFHRDADGFLLTESLRGEGARLLTRDGKPFMKKYHPMGDLAPRDHVARAIAQEIIARGDQYVLLDATGYRGKIPFPERFPTVYSTCLQLGLDLTKEPAPVVPAAHYHCGGVKVDIDARTPLPGLWAAGEVACTGLHGANRLASTSLLEGLLFGYRAAESVATEVRGKQRPCVDTTSIPDWEPPRDAVETDPALIIQDGLLVRSTMWNYAGILRTHDRLSRARADMDYLRHRVEQFYRRAAVTDATLGLRNKIQVALLIIDGALRNKTSRGGHYLIG
jgi:L-aspartate oxidase